MALCMSLWGKHVPVMTRPLNKFVHCYAQGVQPVDLCKS